MKLAKILYEKISGKKAPYYFDYSILKIITKPIRKYFTVVVAPNCPFNCIRIFIYRLCGFKIGNKVFIGMKCYLDDMCYDLLTIGNNVTISYGVYFALHGKNQGHNKVTVKNGAYIGMCARLINNKGNIVIGEDAVIGACTLVNKSIPCGATAVGILCRIIEKEIQNDE